MSERVAQILELVRALSREERLELEEQLDEQSAGTPEEIEAAWAEEIERRAVAIDEGRAKLIPADEALAMLRQRLAARSA